MPDSLTLVITFDRTTGQINVNGPVQDKLFCLGLLEMAKDAVLKYQPAAASPLTLPRFKLPNGEAKHG